MKYTLTLNVKTAIDRPCPVKIDLPLEGLFTQDATALAVREIVGLAYSTVKHAVTREELLALNASLLNGQEAVIDVPVKIDWSPVFAIANTIVGAMVKQETCSVDLEVCSFGHCDGTGVFRMENEKPKRLYLVFPDQDEAYDVDDGNGDMDEAKVRDAVSEIVDDLDSADIEDIVCNNMDVDEEDD